MYENLQDDIHDHFNYIFEVKPKDINGKSIPIEDKTKDDLYSNLLTKINERKESVNLTNPFIQFVRSSGIFLVFFFFLINGMKEMTTNFV